MRIASLPYFCVLPVWFDAMMRTRTVSPGEPPVPPVPPVPPLPPVDEPPEPPVDEPPVPPEPPVDEPPVPPPPPLPPVDEPPVPPVPQTVTAAFLEQLKSLQSTNPSPSLSILSE